MRRLVPAFAPVAALVAAPARVFAADTGGAGDGVDPALVAVAMACAGGFTLIMLIKRHGA
jgi:hypothetical protein